MTQQTALQNLIKELKQFAKFPMVDQPTIEAAIEFAELRLSKEKEQIIDAVDYGCDDYGSQKHGEEYYNQVYGTE
jgi:hypothetical protein